ncbi:hypothetical protein ACFLV2_00720 [Chloroflexota bacterium]
MMSEEEKVDELTKLANIATDMTLDRKLRKQAIELLKNVGTHEALLVLLQLAANERLNTDERDLALKKARDIVKSSH